MAEPQLRTCTRCKLAKALGDFGRTSHSRDGINQWCKPCTREHAKAWRIANNQKHREYSNAWRLKNPDKAKAGKRKAYYAKAEQRRKYSREWHAANRKAVHLKKQQYTLEHAEVARERAKKWREANPERARLSIAKCHAANPESVRASSSKSKAKRRAAPGHYTGSDIKRMFAEQNGLCAACSSGLSKYHVDHMQPLVKGGTNWPDNLQLLCPACNCAKGSKSMEEWNQVKIRRVPESAA